MIFAYMMARLLFIVIVLFLFAFVIRFILNPKAAIKELHSFFTKDEDDDA